MQSNAQKEIVLLLALLHAKPRRERLVDAKPNVTEAICTAPTLASASNKLSSAGNAPPISVATPLQHDSTLMSFQPRP